MVINLDTVLYTTIKEEVKNNLGNENGIYDGEWEVKEINYREKTVDLSNGRISILKNFDEINDFYIK